MNRGSRSNKPRNLLSPSSADHAVMAMPTAANVLRTQSVEIHKQAAIATGDGEEQHHHLQPIIRSPTSLLNDNMDIDLVAFKDLIFSQAASENSL